MCSKQTLCSVSVNCISYFFTGDETNFAKICFFIKQYKVWSVPGLCGVVVDSVKLFTALNTSKMFNMRDGTYTASLFLPLALLAAITFLPFFVFILVLKPCVLFLGVLCGWYVLFILIDPSSDFPACECGYIWTRFYPKMS
jgi:hypothetical protein